MKSSWTRKFLDEATLFPEIKIVSSTNSSALWIGRLSSLTFAFCEWSCEAFATLGCVAFATLVCVATGFVGVVEFVCVRFVSVVTPASDGLVSRRRLKIII